MRFEYYTKIAPAYKEDAVETHRMEPYVYSQLIAGADAPSHGEAKNSWLTGTAAWNFVAISQHILGVRPEHGGLRIDPCIGDEIASYTITRWCRGSEYIIRVTNQGAGSGTRLVVDGKPLDGTLIPYADPGAVITIDCLC